MKVVLVNVKYSSNLGDGIIAECLEAALKARLDNADIISCDLAGRTAFDAGGGAPRRLALAIAPLMPSRLRQTFMKTAIETLVRARLMPGYRRAMAGADIAIFGGGQLLADADLNFPMKIAAASAVARESRLKIAIHSIGVGARWSSTGTSLFREAFSGCDLIWASVRDRLSHKRWKWHFEHSDLREPGLSLDPGILASELFGPADDAENEEKERPIIGVCVTTPATLKLHFDGGSDGDEEADFAELYRGLVTKLAERGNDVRLFTNGASDDDAFLHHCFPPQIVKNFEGGKVEIVARPVKPKELVAIIRDLDGVISHRLHTCVVAFSYGVPHVGLSLNSKVDAFFDQTNRTSFVVGARDMKPEFIADRLAAALDTKILDADREKIIRAASEDIDALAEALLASVGRAAPSEPAPALSIVRPSSDEAA